MFGLSQLRPVWLLRPQWSAIRRAMNIFSVSRRIARRVAALVDLLKRGAQQIVASTARLLQPTSVLIPIKVLVDQQKRAGPRD
jgi:hypothetical protein